MIRWLVLATALAAAPAAAERLRLALPIDCRLGETCFIQNFVDRDPGPGEADFGCGPLTYNGHQGTDFALIDRAAMHAGVDVHPAAPGTVRATRDGMPDIRFDAPGAPDVSQRNCGNAVIIDHGDGWQTRYCHLRQGSVQVRQGMRVNTATLLGQVGLSGKTQFPHLHFGLHRGGAAIDPFQPDGATGCGDTGNALWADPIAYVPGDILAAGFADAIPEYDAVKAGTAHAPTLPATAPALALWVHVFGGRADDVLELAVTGPEGEFLNRTITLERNQARLFRATGRKRRAAPWPAGTYTGTARLLRDGAEIGRITTTTLISN